jgi:hypothetical protein
MCQSNEDKTGDNAWHTSDMAKAETAVTTTTSIIFRQTKMTKTK